MNAVIDNNSGLLIPEETKTNIAELKKVAAGLDALKHEHTSVPDCTTEEGYEKTKALVKQVAAVRIATEKAHKCAKAFYWEGGKRIDSMKKQILEITQPIEDGYKSAIKAVDDEKARIEREAAEAEQARIDNINKKLEYIDTLAAALSLDDVLAAIEKLDNLDLQMFQEFADAAETKAAAALEILTKRRNTLQEQKAEADRLEAARIEQERIAQEQAEAQRKIDEANAEIERKQREAELIERQKAEAAEAARIAADKAEADKQAAIEAARADEQRKAEEARQKEAARIQREKEEAHAAQEAEARRLAAAPDVDKLAAWAADIAEPPAVKSPEGIAAHAVIIEALNTIDGAIVALKSEAASAPRGIGLHYSIDSQRSPVSIAKKARRFTSHGF